MSAPTSGTTNAAPASVINEDTLRQELRAAMQELKKREPLESDYELLLTNGAITPGRPNVLREKLFRKLPSNLRQRVEKFRSTLMSGGAVYTTTHIKSRQPLDDDRMRAAFTLREPKEHEQLAFAAAIRRHPKHKYLQAVALGLQKEKRKEIQQKKILEEQSKLTAETSLHEQKMKEAMEKAQLEAKKAQVKSREEARRRRDEEDRSRRQEEYDRRRRVGVESPRQALHKLYYPLFKKLWEMEFPSLGGSNPFRIVIDRDNCASIGAPDYFSVIQQPMNLTYIKQKVDDVEYETLAEFVKDVDLMINNALKYNSHPENPYHQAALEMRKTFRKLYKKLMEIIQQKQKK